MESYIVSFCLNYDRDLIRIFMDRTALLWFGDEEFSPKLLANSRISE